MKTSILHYSVTGLFAGNHNAGQGYLHGNSISISNKCSNKVLAAALISSVLWPFFRIKALEA